MQKYRHFETTIKMRKGNAPVYFQSGNFGKGWVYFQTEQCPIHHFVDTIKTNFVYKIVIWRREIPSFLFDK